MLKQWTVVLVALVAVIGDARAEGDLGVRGTRMELVVGTGESGFGVSQKNFELVTGRLYQLKIKATGAKECAWEAPQLAATIWLRKVEAGNVEIKAPTLTELEFERESEAELSVSGCMLKVLCGSQTWTRVPDVNQQAANKN